MNSERDGEIRLEHIFYFICFQLQRFWINFKSRCDRNLQEIGAYEALDKLARLSAKHPILAFICLIGTLIFTLPFLILLVFALSTLVLTFTGFIVIEGTLITVASALLFASVAAVAIILTFFGAVVFAGYFGFMHIYDLFKGSNSRTAFNEYMNMERNRTQRRDD